MLLSKPISDRCLYKMFEKNKKSAASCNYRFRCVTVRVIFLGSKAVFTSLLSVHDFIYPKILFHPFEEEMMFFQMK